MVRKVLDSAETFWMVPDGARWYLMVLDRAKTCGIVPNRTWRCRMTLDGMDWCTIFAKWWRIVLGGAEWCLMVQNSRRCCQYAGVNCWKLCIMVYQKIIPSFQPCNHPSTFYQSSHLLTDHWTSSPSTNPLWTLPRNTTNIPTHPPSLPPNNPPTHPLAANSPACTPTNNPPTFSTTQPQDHQRPTRPHVYPPNLWPSYPLIKLPTYSTQQPKH